ncbi:hypothetical protein N7456_003535 [Penicillium angulare]|uniref:Grh/CP2 DB domain-containing protein n=1 Tax=Penicillium angulare TaxID=116970 RepID=A0A9W9KHM7_9EURO|nr:hypothetical protein N7456_003535 [Penicillium angulare]
MFHNRKNSQKPGVDLLSQFQSSFDGVLNRRNSDGAYLTHSYSQDDAQLMTGGRDFKYSPTPNLEGLTELNFSQSFNTGLTPLGFLASQHPGCYTPRSREMGAIFHNQAGSLHSPSFKKFMMPLALHTNAGIDNSLDLGRVDAQCIAPQIVQVVPDIQQPTYDLRAFTHQNLVHGPMNEQEFRSTAFDLFGFDPPANLGTSSVADSAANTNTPSQVSPHSVTSLDFPYPQGKRFRYHAALRTPTAMVKSAEEIPISYLNKGQTYGLMIMDLAPPAATPPQPLQYRTFIRIAFDDERQRLDPALYWRLWKEGRGMDEARQEGKGLTAVEYAPADGDNSHIQLEQAFVDGFCVTWIVEPAASTQLCTIPIRFRFLSTDFSYSKGVKGVPLRFCAKTELLSPKADGTLSESEVCYCKVKLFRDHGAERKQANDLQHVRKSIGKLEQEIKNMGLGGGSGKRRRANHTSTDMKDSGPRSKVAKNSLEDKLALSQDMLASSRTLTVLSLRVAAEDDPDIYPVQISADQDSA